MNEALTHAPVFGVILHLSFHHNCLVQAEFSHSYPPIVAALIVYCVLHHKYSNASCVCVCAHCQPFKQQHQSPPLSRLVLLIVAATLQPDESRAGEAALIAGNEVSRLWLLLSLFFAPHGCAFVFFCLFLVMLPARCGPARNRGFLSLCRSSAALAAHRLASVWGGRTPWEAWMRLGLRERLQWKTEAERRLIKTPAKI